MASMPIAWEPDAAAFAQLLACFDTQTDEAGAKYEDMRRALVRFFEGRGMICSEELADAVFDRVARKLEGGERIINIYGYCKQVARYILLEALRRPENRLEALEETGGETVAAPSLVEGFEKEVCARCLDDCLGRLPMGGRSLIVEYYSDQRDPIEHHKEMAARLGLKREALANRAQRLRDKLKRCLIECTAKN